MSDERVAVGAALAAFHEAIDGVRRAYKELGAAIDGIEDPRRAYEVATEVSEEIGPELQALRGIGPALRGGPLRRIRDSESLTIVELAGRVDMSPARAHQLVKAADAAREERP
jgi:hypothetical protein